MSRRKIRSILPTLKCTLGPVLRAHTGHWMLHDLSMTYECVEGARWAYVRMLGSGSYSVGHSFLQSLWHDVCILGTVVWSNSIQLGVASLTTCDCSLSHLLMSVKTQTARGNCSYGSCLHCANDCASNHLMYLPCNSHLLHVWQQCRLGVRIKYTNFNFTFDWQSKVALHIIHECVL